MKTTNDTGIIQRTAASLLDQVWDEGQMVRLIGVGVSNLDTAAQQLGLWDTELVENQKLENALKEIREKYGENVISRGMNK